MSKLCSLCGGFYDPRCPHYPSCTPAEDKSTSSTNPLFTWTFFLGFSIGVITLAAYWAAITHVRGHSL